MESKNKSRYTELGTISSHYGLDRSKTCLLKVIVRVAMFDGDFSKK